MVGTAEAETMTYREYKIAVWSRLISFWEAYDLASPDYIAERLAVCSRMRRAAFDLPGP